MNIKTGFEFLITKINYVGNVICISTDQFSNEIATVMFFDTEGFLFKICSVYVQTIKNNLEDGTYKEIKRKLVK